MSLSEWCSCSSLLQLADVTESARPGTDVRSVEDLVMCKEREAEAPTLRIAWSFSGWTGWSRGVRGGALTQDIFAFLLSSGQGDVFTAGAG